jgi:hypothetical protein
MSYVSILSRRFLLKLAQDPEAEGLLKKHLGDPRDFEDPLFSQLVERGIIPIVTPRERGHSAHLGEGMYSAVYEVSYKGRLAVAKITGSQKDFDIMLKLDALRPKLGEDAKHLPVIFDKFSVPIPDHDTKYVIIVEKLVPLNSHLKSMLFSRDKVSDTKFNVIKNNIDLVDAMTKIISKFKQNFDFGQISPTIQNKLLELAESAFRKSLLSSTNIGDFRRNLISQTRDIGTQLAAYPTTRVGEKNSISNIIHYIPDYIVQVSGFEENFPIFPIQEDTSTAEHFKNSPEARSFMNFLLRLRKEFGISWGDLHHNNIMVRPTTGDLIISDSGYFTGVK